MVHLREYLNKDCIVSELKGKTKSEVIKELVNVLKKNELIEDTETVYKEVMEREKILSTGIGNGIAIPHAKTNKVDDLLMVFGKKAKGIEYGALDGNAVNIIFLILAPEDQAGAHIRALAKISRLMKHKHIRDKILASKSKEKILEIIEEEDKIR